MSPVTSLSPPDTSSRSLSEPAAWIGGVAVHAPTAEGLQDALYRAFDGDRMRHLSTYRIRDAWRARRDRAFRGLLSRMDLLLPRGKPMAALARLARSPLPADGWTGDLTEAVLRVARDLDRSVYFLGGKGSDPFDWARRARYRFPGLRLAGAHAPGPDFRDAEGGRRLVDRINGSGARVVIGLPTVSRGEEFPFRYASRLGAEVYVNLWAGLSPAWHERSAWKPLAARRGLEIVPRGASAAR